MPKMLTVAEAAEILGVSPGTLREWEKKGLLKSDRTAGKHRRYTREYIEQMRDKGPPTNLGKWWYFKLWDSLEKQRKQAALSKYAAFLHRFNLDRGWEPEDIAMMIENCLTCQQFLEGVEPASSLEMVDQISSVLSRTFLSQWIRVGATTEFGGLISYERLRGCKANLERIAEESEEVCCKTLYLDEDDSDYYSYFREDSLFKQQGYLIGQEISKVEKLVYRLEAEVLTDIANNAATICHCSKDEWVHDMNVIYDKMQRVCDFIDRKVFWKFSKWAVMDGSTFECLKSWVTPSDCIRKPFALDPRKLESFLIKPLNCHCFVYDTLKPHTIIIGCKPHRKQFGYAFNFYLPLLQVNGRETSIYSKKLMREGAKFFGAISSHQTEPSNEQPKNSGWPHDLVG